METALKEIISYLDRVTTTTKILLAVYVFMVCYIVFCLLLSNHSSMKTDESGRTRKTEAGTTTQITVQATIPSTIPATVSESTRYEERMVPAKVSTPVSTIPPTIPATVSASTRHEGRMAPATVSTMRRDTTAPTRRTAWAIAIPASSTARSVTLPVSVPARRQEETSSWTTATRNREINFMDPNVWY